MVMQQQGCLKGHLALGKFAECRLPAMLAAIGAEALLTQAGHHAHSLLECRQVQLA
jgi:hypothetical protein